MVRDWVMVEGNVPACAGVPADWLRGRQPSLTPAAFDTRWCHRGVLCAAAPGDAEPRLRWTLLSPVPVPS